jgi:hypothetical protein
MQHMCKMRQPGNVNIYTDCLITLQGKQRLSKKFAERQLLTNHLCQHCLPSVIREENTCPSISLFDVDLCLHCTVDNYRLTGD